MTTATAPTRRLSMLAVVAALAAFACGKGPSGGTTAGPAASNSAALPPGATPLTAPSGQPLAAHDPTPTAPLPTGQIAPLSFAPIAKRADPSVVTVLTIGEEVAQSPWFANRGRRRETHGLGTGFIVDKDGIIVTNNHVVEDGTQITVRLSDDRELPAKVVGKDPRTDIAVIRIDAHGLTTVPLGDSDQLEVGDWVVAIGNPFGLSHTVSAGIVSAKGRGKDEVQLDPTGYYDFIQTDASINPGNSGGPLFNLKGEVVGVNAAIRGGGAQGIGFAIPINMVKQLLPMLLRDGHLTRSALAVQIKDLHELTAEDRASLKRPDDKGAVIMFVEPNGPADKAGLRAGDVILAFDGKDIDRGSLLQWLASTTGVGKAVAVRVSRDGQLFEQKVTLGELREGPPRAASRSHP